jgi:hypothetical protein
LPVDSPAVIGEEESDATIPELGGSKFVYDRTHGIVKERNHGSSVLPLA